MKLKTINLIELIVKAQLFITVQQSHSSFLEQEPTRKIIGTIVGVICGTQKRKYSGIITQFFFFIIAGTYSCLIRVNCAYLLILFMTGSFFIKQGIAPRSLL